MTATILVPLLICLIGAVVYVVAANPKLAELGRLAFACGLVAVCFATIGRAVHIG